MCVTPYSLNLIFSLLFPKKTYMKDDCSFKENILPDGYNIYVSDKHGTLVSLGGSRQRLQGRDRGIPALSQFLPRVSTLPLDITTDFGLSSHPEQGPQSGLDIDTMDAFGKLSQVSIQSPSFNKRWATDGAIYTKKLLHLQGVSNLN